MYSLWLDIFLVPSSRPSVKVKYQGHIEKKKKIADAGVFMFNFSPDMPILGFSNAAANKDMMSKIWTNGNTII